MKSTKKLLSGVLFFVMTVSALAPALPAFAASYLTLDKFSGPPTSVVVQGGGWASGETVSLYLNTISGTPVTTAIARADSMFGPVTVTIPANTPQGALPIIAVGSVNTQQQSNTYYVVPFESKITVSGSNTPGSIISIDGTGFAVNEVVRFTLNGQAIGQVQANGTGAFTGGSATVPFINPGTYQLHATGANSNSRAIEYFYVGGFFPSITPSTYYLLPTHELNFSGSGFAGGESVKITEGQNVTVLGTITTNNTGSFSNSGHVIIPANYSGSKTFRLTGVTSNASASVEVSIGQFNPSIIPSTNYLLPGEVLTFSGSGFANNETVNVFASDTQTVLSQFLTDNTSAFNNVGSITIPFDWAGSSRSFKLVGQTANGTGTVSITVGQFNSLVSLSSYHILPGTVVTFTGNGFAPNESIKITEGNTATVLATFNVNAGGTFTSSSPFTIPFSWKDTSRTFHLIGQSSGTRADATLNVSSYLPSLTPSAFYIAPGKPLTVAGEGFAPNEQVSITVNGKTVTTTANVTGAFTAVGTFVSPLTGTEFQVTGTGLSSTAVGQATVSLGKLNPAVNPNSWYVASGSTILFTGEGFAPNEQVRLTNSDITLATISADPNGAFPAQSVTTGYGMDRTSTYVFTGLDTGASVSATITIAALQPFIALDTYYAKAGSIIHVNGIGFAGNEAITITLGSATAVATATLGGVVSSTAIMIPFGMTTSTGSVMVKGNTSGAVAYTSVTVAPYMPQVTPNTWYTPRETPVTFTGESFAANETITIKLNGSSVSTATASALGAFTSAGISIPYAAKTAHFEFIGNTSGGTSSIDLTLAPFYPEVTPSAWWAPVGSNIIFSGKNFAPGETVNISFNDTNVATATADMNGKVTTTGINIPANAYYANFVFVGSESKMSVFVPIALGELTPGLMLSIYYDRGGNPLTITGMGFGTYEHVTATFEGQVVGTAMTDGNGTVNVTTTIPYLAAGNKMIAMTGQSSGGKANVMFTQAPFYVDLQLGSYAGAPGSAVNFVGNGYAAGETVTITSDRTGTNVVQTITADADGSFNNSSYIVPADFTEGNLTFTVKGAQSISSVNITYYVTGR